MDWRKFGQYVLTLAGLMTAYVLIIIASNLPVEFDPSKSRHHPVFGRDDFSNYANVQADNRQRRYERKKAVNLLPWAAAVAFLGIGMRAAARKHSVKPSAKPLQAPSEVVPSAKCPDCGEEVPATADSCWSCGSRFLFSVQCIFCGQIVRLDDDDMELRKVVCPDCAALSPFTMGRVVRTVSSGRSAADPTLREGTEVSETQTIALNAAVEQNRCPRCQEHVVMGSEHCSGCGTAIEYIATCESCHEVAILEKADLDSLSFECPTCQARHSLDQGSIELRLAQTE